MRKEKCSVMAINGDDNEKKVGNYKYLGVTLADSVKEEPRRKKTTKSKIMMGKIS